jgi:hypothetical protein
MVVEEAIAELDGSSEHTNRRRVHYNPVSFLFPDLELAAALGQHLRGLVLPDSFLSETAHCVAHTVTVGNFKFGQEGGPDRP